MISPSDKQTSPREITISPRSTKKILPTQKMSSMRIYPRAGCYLRRTVPGQKYHSLMIIRMRIPMLRWSAPCREEDAFHLVFSLVMLICAVASLVTWFVLWGRKGVIPEESYHPLLWISLFTASVGTWFLRKRMFGQFPPDPLPHGYIKLSCTVPDAALAAWCPQFYLLGEAGLPQKPQSRSSRSPWR